jgi:aromatic ring-opening dioxygenase catalytic subunit (LigB family)
MAELVGCFAASHGPLLVRDWARLPESEKTRVSAAFRELGRRMDAARPDVLIEVSPDHWVNFHLENIPAVCLGVGEMHEGPPEPFLEAYPHREMPGHPGFAHHLVKAALAGGFEPSFSYRLKLDHGFCIPLWRMELQRLPRIVPMIVNSIEPPLPRFERCFAWGKVLKEAIESYPEPLRVAILASGGLSHSIGEPTMGRIDEAFDRECINLLSHADQEALIRYLEDAVPKAGNGTDEVRNWLVAHGAAAGRGFQLVDYLPVPGVYVGCGFASWKVGQ